jgi:transposase-like protein
MGKNQRRGSSQWKKIVLAQGRSGLSARAFCRRESIGEAGFYKWRKRFKESTSKEKEVKSADSFIEVGQLQGSAGSDELVSWHIALELGDGVTLNLRKG